MISLDVHQLVDSPFGGVSAPCAGVRHMKERSRMPPPGLTERPRRCASEDVRLRERKSVERPRVVVEDEWEAGTGLEMTRVIEAGMVPEIDGGRIVETDPPRERTDWADCEAGGAIGAERTEVGEDRSSGGIGGVFG